MAEVFRICTHFNISFDELNSIDNESSVTFTFSPLATVTDYTGYLSSIRDDMKRIASSPANRITWAAEVIPIFHHFKFPFLAAFKVYYWFHCIIHTEEHKDKMVDSTLIDDEITGMCREIYKIYVGIPSEEMLPFH